MARDDYVAVSSLHKGMWLTVERTTWPHPISVGDRVQVCAEDVSGFAKLWLRVVEIEADGSLVGITERTTGYVEILAGTALRFTQQNILQVERVQ